MRLNITQGGPLQAMDDPGIRDVISRVVIVVPRLRTAAFPRESRTEIKG